MEERLFAWLNVFQVGRVVHERLEQAVTAKTGRTLAEMEVLNRLARAARPMRMADLAALLLFSKSGLTRLVDRLERLGLVTRETPAENRRVVYASITSAGETALREIHAAYNPAFAAAFGDHVTAADAAVLRRVMRGVLEGNGEWDDERCAPGSGTPPAERPG